MRVTGLLGYILVDVDEVRNVLIKMCELMELQLVIRLQKIKSDSFAYALNCSFLKIHSRELAYTGIVLSNNSYRGKLVAP